MSWYIKRLLIDRYKIKNGIESQENLNIILDLYDDDYNNLLLVEKKVQDLYDTGLIANREMEIIDAISTGDSLSNLEKELGMTRQTIYKIFNSVCEKLAYILGGEFTNEGYVTYIKNKYKLNPQQVEKLKIYMDSIYNLKH